MGERLTGVTPKESTSTDDKPEATLLKDRIPPSVIEQEALEQNQKKFPPRKGTQIKPTDRMRRVTANSHRVTF